MLEVVAMIAAAGIIPAAFVMAKLEKVKRRNVELIRQLKALDVVSNSNVVSHNK